ncbi:hypothetical protein TcG_12299 [Trypanosoma cruzi]|uniref:Uncharacterized protein n=1 Tax=Trypanosoma cruzi TaxID=5693 RepID=A0A2V2UVS8_TRYCR|nr:hypothetical protein C4B63_75g88 [Trypanosoma cruzi]RNF00156.1 hypothetical protein TcG_12299 [Trypanosoma cruzi]
MLLATGRCLAWEESDCRRGASLICLIAEPSTHCTVLVLLSSADKGGSHGVLLLEGSVRRKNIIYSFFFLGETNPFFDSSTSALSQFFLAVGVFGVFSNQWLSLAAPRPNIDWCRRSWTHVAWPINCLCNWTTSSLWAWIMVCGILPQQLLTVLVVVASCMTMFLRISFCCV